MSLVGHKIEIQGWTDYPFVELGDTPGSVGPWRRITVVGYDGDKYARVQVRQGKTLLFLEVKAGYIRTKPYYNWSRRDGYRYAHPPVPVNHVIQYTTNR